MFEDEKQFTKIISSMIFKIENILWFFSMVKILDLAIIISAAINTLNIINVDDIVSIEDMGEIAVSVIWRWSSLVDDISVIKNKEDIVTHQ